MNMLLHGLNEGTQAVLRRHPKGLDASGGGSWSRQKHARAALGSIVMQDLKVSPRA